MLLWKGNKYMNLFSANQMRNIDKYSIEKLNIPSLMLMENAGRKSADLICEKTGIINKKILIICGKGNNAGDGFVIARYLSCYGGRVSVLLTLGRNFSVDAEKMFCYLPNDVEVIDYYNNEEYDIYIDCVFGTGFSGKLPENIADIFKSVNSKNGYKIAIDNPSGLTLDNYDNVFNADLTIEIQLAKFEHYIYPCADFCGERETVEIGIPNEAINTEKSLYTLLDKNFIKNKIKPRNKNSHKGDFGTVASFCGSKNMPGAAIMAGKAVLMTGAGLLKTFSPQSIHNAIASSVPESIVFNLKEDKWGTIDFDSEFDIIKNEISNISCILIGCGLSKSDNSFKLLQYVIKNAECPIVIDADGLNLLSENIDLLNDIKSPVILTPHPGEMARLAGVSVSEIQNNRLKYAKDFVSKYKNITLVLKGAGTIITDGNEIFINSTGNPGMAKGGSGDVLSGMIASFVSQKYSYIDACSVAVFLHGLCGDILAEEKTQFAFLPTDIIEKIPQAFKNILE